MSGCIRYPIVADTAAILGSGITTGGGAFFDCDIGRTDVAGDVQVWASATGGITAHYPTFYGKSGNAPSWDATAFDASRGGIAYDGTNAEALICDGGWNVFAGINSTMQWTVAVQCVWDSIPVGSYYLTSGSSANVNRYIGHSPVSTYGFNEFDDTGVGRLITLQGVGLATDGILTKVKDGTNYSSWWQGISYTGNPVAGSALGQTTVDQLAFGAMFRGADTWSSYMRGKMRRIAFMPGLITGDQAVALYKRWYGK